MIFMSVKGIGIDAKSAQPIVLLKDENGNRGLPIWVGAAEALAISHAMEQVKSKRPTTHELLLEVIEELGFTIGQIDIDNLESNTFHAKIILERRSPDGKEVEVKSIDSRPSDAIVLALSVHAPIFVTPQVLSSGGIVLDTQKDDTERAEFMKFLDNVKASDFRLPGKSEDNLSAGGPAS